MLLHCKPLWISCLERNESFCSDVALLLLFHRLLTGYFAGVPWHWAGHIILPRCCDDYPCAHAVVETHYCRIITGPLTGRQLTPVAMDDDGGIGQGRKVAAVKDLDSHLHLWKINIVHRTWFMSTEFPTGRMLMLMLMWRNLTWDYLWSRHFFYTGQCHIT